MARLFYSCWKEENFASENSRIGGIGEDGKSFFSKTYSSVYRYPSGFRYSYDNGYAYYRNGFRYGNINRYGDNYEYNTGNGYRYGYGERGYGNGWAYGYGQNSYGNVSTYDDRNGYNHGNAFGYGYGDSDGYKHGNGFNYDNGYAAFGDRFEYKHRNGFDYADSYDNGFGDGYGGVYDFANDTYTYSYYMSTDEEYFTLHDMTFDLYTAYTVFIIAIILLGIVGNLSAFAIIVYRGLARRSSLYLCLACIAFLDLTVNLTTGLLEYTVPFLAGTTTLLAGNDPSNRDMVASDVLCKICRLLGPGAALASVWINVTVNVTKLASQISPFGRISLNIKPITRVCCAVAIMFGFSLYAPLVPSNKIVEIASPPFFSKRKSEILDEDYTFDHYAHTIRVCSENVGDFDDDDDTQPETNAKCYNDSVNLIAYSIIPGAILFVQSIVIVGVFMVNYRRHLRLVSGQVIHTAGKNKTQRRDNFEAAKNRILLLLPLSLVHIACTIPLCVSQMYHASRANFQMAVYIPDSVSYGVVSEISKFVVAHLRDINHSVTFYIQIVISTSFRNDLFHK